MMKFRLQELLARPGAPSQAELARSIGVPRQQINRLVRGDIERIDLKTLDRLYEERAGVVGDRLLQGGGVAEGNDLEAGCERSEAVAVLGLGGGRNDGDGAPVEIVGTDDDLLFPCLDPLDLLTPLASRLEGGLHRLGSGVHGQGDVHAGEFVQQLVEPGQPVVPERPAGKGDPADVRGDPL